MTYGAGAVQLLECSNLCVEIDGAPVVNMCSFKVVAGEFVILCGPNGAGKSSLLRALANLGTSSGEVRIANRPASTFSARERARRAAYLPQQGSIHWPVPVRSIVELGRIPFGRALEKLNAADQQAIDRAMNLCDIRHLAKRPAMALSGGERARVLLARAIATEADILLADEPFAALDPAYQLTAMKILRDYASAGHAVIAVTHDISLALAHADRFLVLKNGRLAGDGDGEALFHQGVFDDAFGVRFEALADSGRNFAGVAARQGLQQNGGS